MINSTITEALFESIASAVSKPERNTGSALYKEVLKNEPGKSIYVRLLPNVTNPARTYYTYGTYEFVSKATGEKKFYYTPTVNNENGASAEECRDPVAEYRRRNWKTREEEMRQIKFNSFRLANVYVVKDEVNPENNGKVKLLKVNKTLWSKIQEFHADDEGKKRIYDLGAEGRTFQIKTTIKGEFWNFDTSKFSMPAAIPELNSQAKIDEVYNAMFDLSQVHRVSDVDYITKLLNEHILEATDAPVAASAKTSTTKTNAKETSKPVEKSVASGQEDVDDILKSIGVL